MNKRPYYALIFVLFIVTCIAWGLHECPAEVMPAAEEGGIMQGITGTGETSVKLKGIPSIETTQADRRDVRITVYNDNLALVQEIREIILPGGKAEMRFRDVSQHVIPASVRVKSLGSAGTLDVAEQNYEYNPVTPQALMERYVGKTVRLLEKDDFSGSKGELKAELVSIAQGPVFRIGEEIHIGHPGRIVLPKLPEDLGNEPSLIWKIAASQGGRQSVAVSYLTDNIDWNADYVLVLNPEHTRGDFQGLVTIMNRTGMSFDNVHLQLMAGKVGRVETGKPRLIRMKEAGDVGMMAREVSEEEVFEYHLYDVPETVDIKANQEKQIRLFSTERIPVKKELRYYGGEQFYRYKSREEERPQRVGVFLEFENRKTFHLGLPLPEGIVRVYTADSRGMIQFLGEDRIPHTPEDERVRIRTGYAFDLVVERNQTDWRKPAPDIIEVAWEITLRNQKDQAAWVVIIESVPGEWQVMESSHQWKKEDARTLRFELSIAAKTQERIRYRIQARL